MFYLSIASSFSFLLYKFINWINNFDEILNSFLNKSSFVST